MGVIYVVPLPRRFNLRWMVIGGCAVLAFAVLVMLVVAVGCGGHTSTDPGSATPTRSVVAGVCEPFCSAASQAPPVG